MRKQLFRKGIMVAMVMALLVMTGCSKKTPQNDPVPVDPIPQVPTIVYYHTIPQVSGEVQKELDRVGVKITDSLLTYYKDMDGNRNYHLLLECRNDGGKAYYTSGITVSLYDNNQNLVFNGVNAQAVYGIMKPGSTEYLYANGVLREGSGGNLKPMEYDLSKGLNAVIENISHIQDCDVSKFHFVSFETNVEMKEENGRIKFSGKITNPLDDEFRHFQVHYLLFDGNHHIIGIVPQGVSNLKAKQTQDLFVTTLPNQEITLQRVKEYVLETQYWY